MIEHGRRRSSGANVIEHGRRRSSGANLVPQPSVPAGPCSDGLQLALALPRRAAARSTDPAVASVFNAGGPRLHAGYGLVGGVRYDELSGEAAAFEAAVARFRNRLACLAEQQPFIGHVNRQVIDEWGGMMVNPPRGLLALPRPPGRRPYGSSPSPTSSASVFAADDAVLVNTLWAHAGLRELWLRSLGSHAWMAHARGAVSAARACLVAPAHREDGAFLIDRLLWCARPKPRALAVLATPETPSPSEVKRVKRRAAALEWAREARAGGAEKPSLQPIDLEAPELAPAVPSQGGSCGGCCEGAAGESQSLCETRSLVGLVAALTCLVLGGVAIAVAPTLLTYSQEFGSQSQEVQSPEAFGAFGRRLRARDSAIIGDVSNASPHATPEPLVAWAGGTTRTPPLRAWPAPHRELQSATTPPAPPPFPPPSPLPPPFPPPLPPDAPAPSPPPNPPPCQPPPPAPPRRPPALPMPPSLPPLPPSAPPRPPTPPATPAPSPPPPRPMRPAGVDPDSERISRHVMLAGVAFLLAGALRLAFILDLLFSGGRLTARVGELLSGCFNGCLECESQPDDVRRLLRAALKDLTSDAMSTEAAATEAAATEAAATRLAEAAQLIDSYLLEHVAQFRGTQRANICERLGRVRAAPVGLESFALLRRIGKGAYGEVHVARKEDTLALLALKVIKLQRVRTCRAIDHLQLERETLERVTAARVPFVCTLCYAFRSDTWLVLAIPFFTGGVLEIHLEERAAPPNRGLPLAEVKFLAAQMVLALEGLHGLHILHRDVKPNNLCLRRDGYYVLTDLGLVASLAPGINPPTGRTGSRGYCKSASCSPAAPPPQSSPRRPVPAGPHPAAQAPL